MAAVCFSQLFSAGCITAVGRKSRASAVSCESLLHNRRAACKARQKFFNLIQLNSKMRLREVYKSPNYYSVCECDRTEHLIISVVAGGIAMYEILVELLPEEEARFGSEGGLDSLARDISHRESFYKARTLCPASASERIEYVSAI